MCVLDNAGQIVGCFVDGKRSRLPDHARARTFQSRGPRDRAAIVRASCPANIDPISRAPALASRCSMNLGARVSLLKDRALERRTLAEGRAVHFGGVGPSVEEATTDAA